MANDEATNGQIWVCRACGKTSRDRYGFQKISPGWDESCMLNAVLGNEKKAKDAKPTLDVALLFTNP